jgi:hypothetical protein
MNHALRVDAVLRSAATLSSHERAAGVVSNGW